MHPLRHALHDELHARPSLYFKEPAYVSHVAIMGEEHERVDLLNSFYPEPVDRDVSQGITKLDGHPLKWERHAEFLTLTYITPHRPGSTEWAPLPDALSVRLTPYTHLLINSVQIAVCSADNPAPLDCEYCRGSAGLVPNWARGLHAGHGGRNNPAF